jgi:hypothetical protein
VRTSGEQDATLIRSYETGLTAHSNVMRKGTFQDGAMYPGGRLFISVFCWIFGATVSALQLSQQAIKREQKKSLTDVGNVMGRDWEKETYVMHLDRVR